MVAVDMSEAEIKISPFLYLCYKSTRLFNQIETKMAKKDDDKSGIRRFFTIVTSPIWVPVAAAGSLAAAPFQAVGDSIDVADKTKSAGAGLSSYPGNAIVRVVSNPFKAVAEVGEAMWGKDK